MSEISGTRVPRAKAAMYVQDLAHAPFTGMQDLEGRVKSLDPKRYGIILHDQDTDDQGRPVRDHVHAMMQFTNARSVNSLAKGLGDAPQTVEAWRGDSRNGFAYLCHRTAKARAQHQYDPASVIANFDYPAELQRLESGAAVARVTAGVPVLLDALYAGDLSRDELKAQLTGSQIGRYRRQIEDVIAARLEREAIEWRARMKTEGRSTEVIWLYGPTATGKSSMAKDLAEKRSCRQGYFMRGSTRGLFENYEGQHVLVLDEIGPHSIPYEDLKRITDPWGIGDEIHAPSRYHDKVLMPELIIITSPFNPLQLYRKQVGGGVDAFAQFARRLGLVLHMTQDEIQVMTYDSKKDRYVPLAGAARHNDYSATARAAVPGSPVPDPLEQFSAVCDTLAIA